MYCKPMSFCTLKLYCERLKVKNNVLQVLGTAVFWSFPFLSLQLW